MPLRPKGMIQLCGDLFRDYATPFSPGNVPSDNISFPSTNSFSRICLFLDDLVTYMSL